MIDRPVSFPEKVLKTLLATPLVYVSGWEVLVESLRDLFQLRRHSSNSTEEHLLHLAAWLCQAQDATPDAGVARSYNLVYKPFFRKKGWIGSYPETTGYIIPSFFDYFHFTGQEQFRQRALAMADWEIEVQMKNGAVMGGTVDFPSTEAAFNTGQVIFGWCRAFVETSEGKYIDAAKRAGDFLQASQAINGSWIQGSSRFAAQETTVYTARCSWALLLLDSILKKGTYRTTARRNLEWALCMQKPNGWFNNNCLDNAREPLVHTIAYAVQGILESGLLLEDDRLIGSAVRTAEVMSDLVTPEGALAGRYDENWKPTVNWSCLTGNLQMAIVWFRLHQMQLSPSMDVTAQRTVAFSKSLHDLRTRSAGRRGGVKGAHPIYGKYGRFEYVNWAAKFFMDALLWDEKVKGNSKLLAAEKKGAPIFWGT